MIGTEASPGIAIGTAILLFGKENQTASTDKKSKDQEIELNRYYQALNEALDDVKDLKNKVKDKIGRKEAHIFSFQEDILRSEDFSNSIEDFIKKENFSAEEAVKRVIRKYVAQLVENGDSYLQVNEDDLKDVGDRLLKLLQGQEIKINIEKNNIIIVTKKLNPSQIARFDTSKVLGIVTAEGSATSHAAILADSLNIPAVVGIGEENLQKIKQGDKLIVDGHEGLVHLNPNKDILLRYQKKLEQDRDKKQKLQKYKNKKLTRSDGTQIYISGNIGNSKEAATVKNQGGEGIGLFRTEFLFLNQNTPPTEEEQLETYREVLQVFPEDPVIIRTLDIGGDKDIPGLDLSGEENPYLGYRAIRVCLDYPDFFRQQLRAILRAAAEGNVKLMYPMISSLEEVRAANSLLREARGELDAAGKEYGELEVGIMIEVPAAIAMARELAREVDFFSIGTNDLIQYAVAVDRRNERVKGLFTPFHPSVLRMVTKTATAAKEANIKVYMCGEAAGEKLLLPFWLGLEIDQLSMNPSKILEAKRILSQWLEKDTQQVVEEVLSNNTTAEIQYYLSRLFEDD